MANDFSADPNCVALWRFESGALTTDSKGSNTLTAINTPTADTGDYKEGAASVSLVKSSSQYFSIADASLPTDFPCKNGGTGKIFSICAWFKSATLVEDNVIIGKWLDGYGLCFVIDVLAKLEISCLTNGNGLTGHLQVWGRWNNQDGRMVSRSGVTYEDSSGSAVVRLYRPSTGLAYTYTHSFTANSIGTGTSPVTSGSPVPGCFF